MATEPTVAAKRAVENLGLVSECADVIDEQTGLPELIAALQWYVDNDETDESEENEYWIVGKCNAQDALKIAREGRS